MNEEAYECLSQYAAYMEEVKRRLDVVSKVSTKLDSGSSVTGYIETDIDLVYLQLRKIIELVMFACVVANKSAGLVLNKTLRKGYEIQKIKSELQRFNLNFFPSPKVYLGVDDAGVHKIDDLKLEDRAFMTESELFKAYGAAGNYLHSQRDYQYGEPGKQSEALRKSIESVNSLAHLLDYHWTEITEDFLFSVMLNRGSEKTTQVALFAREHEAFQ